MKRRLCACVLFALAAVLSLLAAPVPPLAKPAPLDCTGQDGVSASDVRKAQEAWAKYLRRKVEETVEVGDLRRAGDLRPVKPTHDSSTLFHRSYDGVFNGNKPLTADERNAIRMTKEMPRTACKSVEVVHYEAAKRAHERTIDLFTTASGFGFVRMFVFPNSRGIATGAKGIDRAELVSLLKEEQPAAYVLDEMATPPRARAARRRSLDEFEERGLQAVRRGAALVWSPEAPNRMFGAVRARQECIDCHSGAREGDLLGAFSYFLTTPVVSLGEMSEARPKPAR
jgi:hypothetical protein